MDVDDLLNHVKYCVSVLALLWAIISTSPVEFPNIRRTAEAYYENLSDEKKRNARFSFNEMDKNEDGKINLDEYVEYLKKDNNTGYDQLVY